MELSDGTLTEFAKRMKRDVSTLSAAIRRFEVYRGKNPECVKKLQMLQQKLQVAILQS